MKYNIALRFLRVLRIIIRPLIYTPRGLSAKYSREIEEGREKDRKKEKRRTAPQRGGCNLYANVSVLMTVTLATRISKHIILKLYPINTSITFLSSFLRLFYCNNLTDFTFVVS